MTLDLNVPIPPRPYSKIPGSEPSVTTIIGMKYVPGLDWAAAKLTAEQAVYHPEYTDGLDPDKAIDQLRKYFNGIWNGRKYMGTLVHKVNESWIHSQSVDVLDLVMAYEPWVELASVKAMQANLYVDGLQAWWQDYKPSDIASEECVRTPGQYVGQRDMVCSINGERWLIDLKCTDQQDMEKAIYGDSWALQLAAYRHAREVVTYQWAENSDSKGKPKRVLVIADARLNDQIDHCGIIHLRGDGEYQFYEIEADLVVYDAFLSLAHMYTWQKTCPKPVRLNVKVEAPV